MSYYYDLYINLNDEYPYSFYEWIPSDIIEHVKKLPIFRISVSSLKEIILNHVIFSKEILSDIEDRTEIYKSENPKYMFALTDGKNAIVLELNNEGKDISISTLLPEEENNLCEISSSFYLKKMDYDIISQRQIPREIRKEKEIKKVIELEIDTLYKNENYNKLKYLYFEWFNETEENVELILARIKSDLKSEFKNVHESIYNLIKLSYQK